MRIVTSIFDEDKPIRVFEGNEEIAYMDGNNDLYGINAEGFATLIETAFAGAIGDVVPAVEKWRSGN